MKALVTGAAGFIGSHLTGALLDRETRWWGSTASPLLPRALKEANLDANRNRSGFTFVERRIQDADLPALLAGVMATAFRPLQAGGKTGDATSGPATGNNVDASQQLLEACVGRPLRRFVYASSSSLYGDNVQIPTRESAAAAGLPIRRHEAGRRAALLFYFANHAVPTTSLRYFTVYGPRQRPDMAFHRFIRASLDGQPITLRRWRADARLHPGRRRRRNRRGGRQGRAGAGLQRRRWLSRLNEPGDRHHRPHCRPSPRRAAGADAEGDMRDTHADTSLARADLGFSPSVTLEQGIEGVSMAFSTTCAHERRALSVSSATSDRGRVWRVDVEASARGLARAWTSSSSRMAARP